MEDDEEYILGKSTKIIENNLLEHFIFLKDENKKIKFYSEFNIEDENNDIIINMWENIINYIYEEIFHCMSLSMSDLKLATRIKNTFPADFNKIIQYLRYNKKYITNEDLNNENFYIENFPYLYRKSGYISVFWNYIFPNSQSCKSNSGNIDDNQLEDGETPTRNDLSKNYMSQIIPENSYIINYNIFKNHCNAMLIALKDILNDEGEEIIMKNSFEEIIERKYIYSDSNNGKFKLNYGREHLDEALFYLFKTKQIIIFQIQKNKDIKFIKVSENKSDTPTKDDLVVAQKIFEEYKNNFESKKEY